MRLHFIFLLLLCLLLFFIPSIVLAESGPDLTATSALLMDYTTGKVLYQKNAHEKRPPASTTKIVTAIIAIEQGNLHQTIITSNKASKADGSSIWLASGEEHSLNDLLYGVLLSSGNDASIAVAEAIAGSESKFAALMNEKAKKIGAKDTNFVNCNGLPEKNHYSTAYDLAVITRYALHNSVFTEIVRTKKKIISWPGHEWDRVMYNHNKLLWRYEYADGVKTGFTKQAGRCLVSSATKNGHRLIAVVLKSKDMYSDSKELFEYGFNHFQLYTVTTPDNKLGEISVVQGVKSQVPVSTAKPVNLVIPRGIEKKLKVTLELPELVKAPVKRMQPVGELEVQLGNQILDRVPVVTVAPVLKKSIWLRILDWFIRILH